MTDHHSESILWFHEKNADTQPGVHNFIDLCQADKSGVSVARTLVETLLNENALSFEAQCNKNISEKFFQVQLDAVNTLAYNGFHTLGLGFPIIKLRNPNQKNHCLAPLFIWKINLEQSKVNPQHWKIIHKGNDSIRLNYALYQYIKQHHKVDLQKLSHPILSDKRLNRISLSKICYELSGALGKKEDFFIEKIHPISTLESNNIICAAAISNFSNPDICVPDKIVEKKEINQKHPFSIGILDPWQEKAFEKVWSQSHTQVLAKQGSGKSHLLQYSLTNALSNGLNSIILVDSLDRIHKIRQSLASHNLDGLMLDITDPEKDLHRIIQALQFRSSTAKEEFDKARFEFLINRCQRQKDRLDNSFNSLQKPLFDKTVWSEVVGNYLSFQRQEKPDLLDNQLEVKDFTFHPTEYLSLKEAVLSSKPLYQKINDLKHPFHQLHPDIFLEKTKEEAKVFVQDQLNIFHNKFHLLHRRYILKRQDYAKDLNHLYESFFEEAILKIEHLKDLIEDNRLLYGPDFEKTGLIKTGKLKVYGVFSEKHKNILQARNQINEQYQSLRSFLLSESEEDFILLDYVDNKAASKIVPHLNQLEDELYQWKNKIEDSFQETLQRLNAKSIHKGLDYSEQINELEYSLDMDIETLNASGIYQLPLQNRMLTIPMRQLFIQDILDQLSLSINHLADFDDFYDWQRHWLLMPEVHRKLITALIKVQPKDWQKAFQSWYFFQRLKMEHHFRMPKNAHTLEAFETDRLELGSLLPVQIRKTWKHKAPKKGIDKTAAKLPLNELINTHFEQIVNQFPIIVMTYPVAGQLTINPKLYFDLAFIFQDNTTAEPPTHLASKTIAFASNGSNRKQVTKKPITLNNIHKKTPLSSFSFMNEHVFHQRKKLIAPRFEGQSFSIKNLNGPFKQNLNLPEADAIIEDVLKLSNQKEVQASKTAIIASTFEQRNFIAKKLKAHNINYPCLHLLEPRSNHYDQLFFTLGVQEFRHSNGEPLNYLNNKIGFQAVEKLVSSNFSKVNIYHSLHDLDIDKYISYNAKKGTRLIAQWIRHAQNIHGTKSNHYSTLSSENIFLAQVAEELMPYIGKQRIELNAEVNGLIIPLLVHPANSNSKPVAILGDYCIHEEAIQAHLWKNEIVKNLKAKGIDVIPAWSANWFEHPALEARRLASTILKKDREVNS